MKKLLILTTLSCGLLTACSENPNKESEAAITTEQGSMNADSTTVINADSTQMAIDSIAKDSADAAHGHSH